MQAVSSALTLSILKSVVLEILFMLCSHDSNLHLSLEQNNLITQHSRGGEKEENRSKVNSVPSHPFSSVPSQVTQTPHWSSEAAVHCTAPSAVQHCTELEEQGFLEACHLSLIKWKEAQLFFAPRE